MGRARRLACLEFGALPPESLSPHSRVIMAQALRGFASLGTLIGGLGTMAPARRAEIVARGGKAVVSGTLATLLMGAMAGVFLV